MFYEHFEENKTGRQLVSPGHVRNEKTISAVFLERQLTDFGLGGSR
jgi:hypothetical protein